MDIGQGVDSMSTQHAKRSEPTARDAGHEEPDPTSGRPDAEAHRPGHRPPRKTRGFKIVAAAVLIAAAAAAAYGIFSRGESDRRLARWTDAQAVPSVQTAHPETSTAGGTLVLPGDVQAFYEASIYARVPGYLRTWSQDIGARVKAGQALATIETPDLDQEMLQAQANLALAEGKSALADLTSKRWHALLASNAVSVQSADEKAGDADAERAAVNAQKAQVARLKAMLGFKTLTAPFDGVVTARNTDVGALINAGSSAASPMFKVADMHQMRVYVHVPQNYASALTVGMKATLTEPQYPGRTFDAVLATTSQSVTAESRTLLVELMADNADGKLLPGTYAEVTFHLPATPDVLRVPSSALIFRQHGAQLATVGADGRVKMKSVTIAKNLGAEIEILSGVSATDEVVTAPPDSLDDGEEVRVVKPQAKQPASGGDGT